MTTITAVRATAPPAAPPLSFDERLALAPLAISEQPFDLADVIRIPVAVPQTPMTTSTPVADLLWRAQARVLRPGGWSRDTGTNSAGGDCLEYAMQAEARNEAEEREARILLRQVIGSGDPITHINRQLTGAGQAGQLLGQAAALADARGL